MLVDTDVFVWCFRGSAKAMFYVQEHFFRHSLQLAGALIAAGAVHHGHTIMTASDRHCRVGEDLQIKWFRP